MSLKDAFVAELKYESALTRKVLERTPLENKDWKPHEKSFSIGRLATHIAELPHWIADIVHVDNFDFTKDFNLKPAVAASQEELLRIYQDNLDKAINSLQEVSDEELGKIWTLRRGEQVLFQLPKKVAIRSMCFNHIVHHRGQLTVYLRLLNVPVPGLYGPSADEKM